MPVAEVVTLYEKNFRDPVSALRKIADEIEQGKYGEVGTVAVAVLGETLEVFGAGPDSAGPSIGMLLSAAHMKIAKAIASHGTH